MNEVMEKIQIKPLSCFIGADVSGVNIAKKISAVTFKKILAAWYKYGVLRFRNQILTDDALVTFSENFGQLDLAPTGRGGSPFDLSRPEIAIISNIIIDGNNAGSLGNSELVWHQDMSYVTKPPKASILYGIKIPKDSGDTSFYNLYKAYTSLSSDLKKRLEGLSCKHDATRNSAGVLRTGYNESYSNEKRPGAIHPLVIRHPQTGRHALYLGRRPNAWIVGLTSNESNELLDKLWSHITNQSFIWTQKWHKNDLVIWDNRCTFHRRGVLDPKQDRLMHRTQVADTSSPEAAYKN